MEIYLTQDNLIVNLFVNAPYAKILNITNEQFEQIKSAPDYSTWKYNEDNNTFNLVYLLDNDTLRERRQKECFNLIDNKSKLWWDNLSKEDYQELSAWYKAWLDVTITKIIPELPAVFKEN